MTATTPDFGASQEGQRPPDGPLDEQQRLLDELGRHPHVAAMAQAVVSAAETAFAGRSTKFPREPQAGRPVPPSVDPQRDFATAWGNCWEVLEHGARSAEQVSLIGALLALGLRPQFPSSPEQERAAAALLIWLTAHTSCAALPPLERLLGAEARPLWLAVSALVEDPLTGGVDFGRTESLVAAVSLGEARAEAAREIAGDVAPRVDDLVLRSLLAGSQTQGAAGASSLVGELAPPPKSPWVTAILAVTLVLAVAHVSRLIARYVFAYKRPAKLVLSQRGLEVTYHTELLGRTLRERATLVPLSNLASVTREVRFARLGMYAGLVALVIGSYVGMGLFVDGVRVPGGSATLLGLAVLFILLGLLIDFALSSLSDSVRGKCRLLVVPRKGRALCVGSLNPRDADAVLSSVAEQARL